MIHQREEQKDSGDRESGEHEIGAPTRANFFSVFLVPLQQDEAEERYDNGQQRRYVPVLDEGHVEAEENNRRKEEIERPTPSDRPNPRRRRRAVSKRSGPWERLCNHGLILAHGALPVILFLT
ncbi:MAG: hypothetical protein M5R36_15055 [Deltaproteobacteria bacterium]|nr:hypothetical protein [Deltaproteobacteria bacterium]